MDVLVDQPLPMIGFASGQSYEIPPAVKWKLSSFQVNVTLGGGFWANVSVLNPILDVFCCSSPKWRWGSVCAIANCCENLRTIEVKWKVLSSEI